MATKVHCIYCFESLAAKLDSRPLRLSLPQIQELWTQYARSLSGSSSTDSNTDDEEDEVEDEEENEAAVTQQSTQETGALQQQQQQQAVNSTRPTRRLGFGHLLSLSPTPTRSQSSTPSSVGSGSLARSSPSEAPSKSSSRSSFFSPTSGSPAPTPAEAAATVLAVGDKGSGKRRKIQALAQEAPDSPLFVTWNVMGRFGQKSLRGCIGTFETQVLEDGLRNYALTAALEDTRFDPVSRRELSSLEVGVTLLTDFEACTTPMVWELGLHGLRISFTHHSKRYGATYLPDVAVEQGWSKEETIISLMRKAGWSGRKDDWKMVSDLKVTRYQGKKSALSHREWEEWRGWVEKQGLV